MRRSSDGLGQAEACVLLSSLTGQVTDLNFRAVCFPTQRCGTVKAPKGPAKPLYECRIVAGKLEK
jgi:hypothetical protein